MGEEMEEAEEMERMREDERRRTFVPTLCNYPRERGDTENTSKRKLHILARPWKSAVNTQNVQNIVRTRTRYALTFSVGCIFYVRS